MLKCHDNRQILLYFFGNRTVPPSLPYPKDPPPKVTQPWPFFASSVIKMMSGGVVDPGAPNLHAISGVKMENARPEVTEFHLQSAVRGIHRSESAPLNFESPVRF